MITIFLIMIWQGCYLVGLTELPITAQDIKLNNSIKYLSVTEDSTYKKIEKNNMVVSWYFTIDSCFFEMSAPNTGWVAIGFNEYDDITGTYLVMGAVNKATTVVVEYLTSGPGNYAPLSELGIANAVDNVSGLETSSNSTIAFSLPRKPYTKYQKNIEPGKTYYLIMAYSEEDDFKHHSMMRTMQKIIL